MAEKNEHLRIVENRLKIAGLDVAETAQKFGTPVYIYNMERIVENYRVIKAAFLNEGIKARIHYAMKANSNPLILKALNTEGAWIDAVSPNEAELAMQCGFHKNRILFTGTSASDDDLKRISEMGLETNADSLSHLRRLAKISPANRKISFRVNPDVGAGLHEHTITAGKFVKFGITEEKVMEAVKLATGLGFKINGIHEHIGSGWLGKDVKDFLETVEKLIETARKIEAFTGEALEFIDFGGGPGIPYRPGQEEFPMQEYASGIAEAMKKSKLKAEVAIEPGRYVVGDAGILVAKINTVEEKHIPVIGVDAGFNCLVRPAFYGAYHEIIICENAEGKETKEYMVAGNLCESGDVFTENRQTLRKLPVAEEGMHIAILNAGAYGFTMASNYNLRPRPREVMVKKGSAYLARDLENLADMNARTAKEASEG